MNIGVTGKNGEVNVTIDYGIDDVKPEEFDALFIPGGFSPDILRADDRFVQFAKYFMDAKKPVFAICHGPQLLITAKTHIFFNFFIEIAYRFVKIFNCLKSGLELLSTSSASAGKSLKDTAVGLNSIKKG